MNLFLEGKHEVFASHSVFHRPFVEHSETIFSSPTTLSFTEQEVSGPHPLATPEKAVYLYERVWSSTRAEQSSIQKMMRWKEITRCVGLLRESTRIEGQFLHRAVKFPNEDVSAPKWMSVRINVFFVF